MGIGSFLRASFGSLYSEAQYGFCDGLRALAVIWVCAYHACLIAPMSNLGILFTVKGKARWSVSTVLAGSAGVDVFFVLSGFLIGSSLCRELLRTGHVRFGTFVCRRFFRIFPALYSVLLITIVVSSAMGKTPACPPPAWWQNLFLVNNYFKGPGLNMCLVQTWSISVEFQQYLATPVLFGIASGIARLGRAWNTTTDRCVQMLCVLGWTACCGSRFAHLVSAPFNPVAPDSDLYLHTQYRCAPYLAGLIAGMASIHQTEHAATGRSLAPLGTVSFCFAMAVMAYAALFGIDDPQPWWLASDGALTTPILLYGTFSRPVFGACLAYIMYLCASGQAPRLARVLGWPVWRPMARLSYSMYLLQTVSGLDLLESARDAILNVFGNDTLGLLVLAIYIWVAVYIAGVVPLALVNYMLVECPGQRVGKYLLGLHCWSVGPAAAAVQKPARGGDLEANPKDLEANPKDLEANPKDLEANPTDLEANPKDLEAADMSSLPTDCNSSITSEAAGPVADGL